MVKVFTAQLGRYRGSDLLDITVKSGERAFAPSWHMVMGYKQGLLSEAAYSERYPAMMRDSYKKNRSVWDELLARDEVTLACYCRPGEFCHRLLLAEILVKLGATYCGER